MSISPIAPQAPSPQGPSAPTASPSDPSAANKSAARAAAAAKPDADGDFDGSKTAADDAVKVTLSQTATKALADNQKKS